MKRVLIGLCVVVAVLVLAGLAAVLLVDANRFRPQVQDTLGQALGRQVTLGRLHVAVWSGALKADDIRIADDRAFGAKPFVTADSLAVGVRLWPLLLHRELHITSLTLDQPQVRLIQNRAGRWNFASLGGASAPAGGDGGTPVALSVDRLAVTDGRIDLVQAGGPVHTYREVRISASHVGTAAAFPFSVRAAMPGGGQLQLAGTAGPWQTANGLLTPLEARLQMHDLDLVGAGLVGANEGVGGRLDLDTRIHSTGGVLRSDGHIQARQLQLVAAGAPSPQPVDVDYHASYRLTAGTGQIDKTTLGAGKARMAVNGSFDNRPAVMRMNLHLDGKLLPVDDLQPLMPAFGVILPKDSRLSGGTFNAALTARGPLDALVIAGPVSLDNSRLAGYSLGSKLGGVLSLAGVTTPRDTVIRHAEATLTVAPAGITADPLSAVIAGLGSLAGKGRMAADGGLDFRMLVKLDKAVTGGGSGQGGVAGLLGNSKAGRVLGGVLGGSSEQGIGVRVGGTASAPSFKVDPTAVTGLLKAGLNGAAKSQAAATPTPAKAAPSKRAVLDSLLRGALQPKKDASGGGH